MCASLKTVSRITYVVSLSLLLFKSIVLANVNQVVAVIVCFADVVMAVIVIFVRPSEGC